MTDLTKQIRAWTDKGWEVVLMVNANENLGDQEGALRKLVEDTGLLDAHKLIHDSTEEPNSHICGKKKIDYVLVTPGAADCITACGTKSFGTSVDSDHRGMFVDFDSIALFGDMTQEGKGGVNWDSNVLFESLEFRCV